MLVKQDRVRLGCHSWPLWEELVPSEPANERPVTNQIRDCVARHGSGSTIHVQSPSRATHTAGGIERHTSASVSKSAQAQSEPSGGQFSIQYQQVLR